MSRKKNLYDCGAVSDFYCTECGNKGIPIFRRANQKKEPGHLKKLYCPICKKDTNHVEVKPYGLYTHADFELEFELGRFVEGNRIALTDLIPCSNINCKYNINNKCWNANKNYYCEYRKDKNNE